MIPFVTKLEAFREMDISETDIMKLIYSIDLQKF